MATYTLQKARSGFIPPVPDGGGAFTIGFPMATDQNMPQPYTPASGDVIQLGYIPKGFLVLSAWFNAGSSGTSSSTWFFGDTGPSSRISGSTDVVVSGQFSRYFFLQGVPAIFFGNAVIPAMSLATAVLFTMTCNAVNGSGVLTGNVFLRGTMDFQNSTINPAGSGAVTNGMMGTPEVL